MIIKKLLFVTMVNLILTLSSFTHAEEETYQTVKALKIMPDQAFIYADGLTQCASSTHFVRLEWLTGGADKMWASILAAKFAGKRVAFGGSCDSSDYFNVSYIYIEN